MYTNGPLGVILDDARASHWLLVTGKYRDGISSQWLTAAKYVNQRTVVSIRAQSFGGVLYRTMLRLKSCIVALSGPGFLPDKLNEQLY